MNRFFSAKWKSTIGMMTVMCLLVWLVRYDISSISYFAPLEKVSNFTMEDFYQSVTDRRTTKQLCREVLIVAIDSCDRHQIADVLERIDYCQPAAIGLDVLFDYPTDNDSALMAAVAGCQHLVLPVQLTFDVQTDEFTHMQGSFFHDRLPSPPHLGAVNLAGSSQLSIVREFRPFFTQGTDTVPHIVTALLQEAQSEAYTTLRQREETLLPIYYPEYEFHILHSREVLDAEELIAGRMVLVGCINDPTDCHLTPVSSEMPGVLIHAHSLATALHQAYITQAPAWMNWLIALLLSLLMLRLKLHFSEHPTEGMLIRLLQLLLLYLIVVSGYTLFVRHHYSLDFTFALLMVGLGFIAFDVWGSLVWLSQKIMHVITHKFQHKHHEQSMDLDHR